LERAQGWGWTLRLSAGGADSAGGGLPPFPPAEAVCHLPQKQPRWQVPCQHLRASSAGLCVPLVIHLQKAARASGCAQGGL